MDAISTLKDLHFTERESLVYLALLQLGSGTPLSIANKTGLKRPTVYLTLESLRRKRMAGLMPGKKNHVYLPEAPGQLFLLWQEQERTLKAIVPFLRGLSKGSPLKPQVKVYDNIEEIVALKRKIWHYPDRMYINHFEKFTDVFGDMLHDYFRLRDLHDFPPDREIFSNTPGAVRTAARHQTPKHQIRVLPKGLVFDMEVSIWGDHVGLYSYDGNYLFDIENNTIARAFRTIFEIAWLTAEKIPYANDNPNNPHRQRKHSAT